MEECQHHQTVCIERKIWLGTGVSSKEMVQLPILSPEFIRLGLKVNTQFVVNSFICNRSIRILLRNLNKKTLKLSTGKQIIKIRKKAEI